MWLEEAKEFVKVCIDGLMLLHRIFSVQNRERAREREMVNANLRKFKLTRWLSEGHLTIKSRILYLTFLQKSYPLLHNF
jgi:hypothetical protein